jgi:hypothetical protein
MHYFEFIDEFHLTAFSVSVDREQTGKSFSWKGAQWYTKLVTNSTGAIGLFLGFESLSTTPDDFSQPMEFRYSLLTMGNVTISSSK